MNLKQEPAKINVFVPVKVQVRSNPALANYTTNERHQKILKRFITKELEKNAMHIIQKTQTDYQAEPFRWYVDARKQFWTYKDFQQYNWQKRYADADVNVQFKVTIENFGEQIRPPRVNQKVRD